MSEIVNPASGTVSWRICATVPKGRQLSAPFCFDYDSAGVHHLESFSPGNPSWASDTSYLAAGGWSYSLPMLSETQRQDVSGGYQCDYATDYMFQGLDGQRHAMGLAIVGPAPGAPSNSCSQTSPTRTTVTTAGEGPILATTTAPSGGEWVCRVASQFDRGSERQRDRGDRLGFGPSLADRYRGPHRNCDLGLRRKRQHGADIGRIGPLHAGLGHGVIELHRDRQRRVGHLYRAHDDLGHAAGGDHPRIALGGRVPVPVQCDLWAAGEDHLPDRRLRALRLGAEQPIGGGHV